MQMVKTDNSTNIYIPKEGNANNLFERLFEFIEMYDTDWKNRIKPASENSINQLIELSEISKYNRDIPIVYRKFLKKMGQDDGGLLSEVLLGETKIDEIIELLEDYHKYDSDYFENLIFPFCIQETGIELSFDLSSNNQEGIWITEGSEIFRKTSESFEKLLFQCAFKKFVSFSVRVCYGASKKTLGETMRKANISNIFEELNKIIKKYGIIKTWFSDFEHYIGIGGDIVFYMEYHNGVVGEISGRNYTEVNDLLTDIINITGARTMN